MAAIYKCPKKFFYLLLVTYYVLFINNYLLFINKLFIIIYNEI